MEEEKGGVQRFRQKKESDGVSERRRRTGRGKRGRAEGMRRREKERSLCIFWG